MIYPKHFFRTMLEYVRGAKTMMFHIVKTFHVEQGNVGERKRMKEPQKDTHGGYAGHISLTAKNAENTEKRR